MEIKNSNDFSFAHLKNDIPASIVVFLVALPLCMGIALASKAPLFSGIMAGIVGGIVVGLLGGSRLSVSGPAAGLTTIVIASIEKLGSYEIFVCSVVLAGVFQVLLGLFKAGSIGNYVPSTVIKGMLAAIGLILILKQIPHALGYDADYEGDQDFEEQGGDNTFTTIVKAIKSTHIGAIIISAVSVLIMVVWEIKRLKACQFFQLVPGALIAVLAGIAINTFVFPEINAGWVLSNNHLANIPVTGSLSSFAGELTFPVFSNFGNINVWTVAITIAIVASLESLLSVEAVDKLDPEKQISSKNRELTAQGTGNIISGLLGGLPVTAVIVRSSANINAGAKTRISPILHGILLFLCVFFIAPVLNLIPLATLAGVLFLVGYKLITPKIFKTVAKRGKTELATFIITILAILFSNLLTGIVIGIAAGLFFTIKKNRKNAISYTVDGNKFLIYFKKDVYFMSIQNIKDILAKVPKGGYVLINSEENTFIDPDVVELVKDFSVTAKSKKIELEIEGQLAYIVKGTQGE